MTSDPPGASVSPGRPDLRARSPHPPGAETSPVASSGAEPVLVSRPPEGGDGSAAWLAAGAALLTLLLLSPTLLFPYGRDQSVFAYVGTVLARGGMPYRDAWELKPPGVYLLYGLLARVAPGAEALMLAVRIADVALAALTGALLALLARRWLSPAAALAAAAWYAGLYLHGGYWSVAQAEAWANPLIAAAALLCLRTADRKGGGVREVALAGLLAGGVVLLKFTALLPLLPFLALAVWRERGRRVARAAAFAAGVGLPCLAALAWLVRGQAWEAYLEIQRGFVVPYVHLNAPGPAKQVSNLFGYTLGWLGALWLPALLAGAGLLPHPGVGHRGRTFAGLALLAGAVSVWVQGKYFLYHWETALPWLALLSALGAARLAGRARLPPRALPAAAVALALAWSLVTDAPTYRDAALAASGRLSRETWLERFGRPGGRGGSSFLVNLRAAEYVRRHTRPGDGVLVWGFEPAIYLFSGRRPPTRFFFNVGVGVTYTPPHWRAEFLADLRRRPPRLVLVAENDAIPWANGRPDDSASQLRSWPELDAWFRRYYRPRARIVNFTVYGLVRETQSSGGRE